MLGGASTCVWRRALHGERSRKAARSPADDGHIDTRRSWRRRERRGQNEGTEPEDGSQHRVRCVKNGSTLQFTCCRARGGKEDWNGSLVSSAWIWWGSSGGGGPMVGARGAQVGGASLGGPIEILIDAAHRRFILLA